MMFAIAFVAGVIAGFMAAAAIVGTAIVRTILR